AELPPVRDRRRVGGLRDLRRRALRARVEPRLGPSPLDDVGLGAARAARTESAERRQPTALPGAERWAASVAIARGDLERLLAGAKRAGGRDPRQGEPDRAIDPLELVLAARFDLDSGPEAARGLGGDQDVVAELARRRLDACGNVHGVADDREVEPPGAADRSGDDRPAV